MTVSQPLAAGAVAADPPDAAVPAHYGDPYREQRLLTGGAGLVDSPKKRAKPGTTLNLKATPAPNPRAAAEYYPAGYWFSLIRVPAESEFPGTGPGGNGIDPNIKSQAEYLRPLKNGACMGCHQLGSKGTRELHPALGTFESSAKAWERREWPGRTGCRGCTASRPSTCPRCRRTRAPRRSS